MKNIIDYVAQEYENFFDKTFNTVDSLVLSQFAYLNFDGLVPNISDLSRPVKIGEITLKENHNNLTKGIRDSVSNLKLIQALANSPRFSNVEITFYVNKTDFHVEKQFSAITYLLEDGTAYIAFRGTDSSFVGWKEDFNMAFISPIPSQEEGVKYVNAVAKMIFCDLKIGGHSKGGNIAVYSAIKCNELIKGRITHIFSHDGPGFNDEIFLSQEYLSMKERIHKTIPQSAIIGMLMQNQEKYTVVKSNRFWFMQHDPFSWLINGCEFHNVKTVNSGALFMNKTLNNWISSIDDSKRELFADTLYHVMKASGALSFYDLTVDWFKKTVAIIGAIKDIDDETRSFILKTIGSLFVFAIKNLRVIRWESSRELMIK